MKRRKWILAFLYLACLGTAMTGCEKKTHTDIEVVADKDGMGSKKQAKTENKKGLEKKKTETDPAENENVVNTTNENETENIEIPENSSTLVTAEDALYIREICSREGSFKDQWGTEYPYSIHIPQVISDSSDARNLNWAIQEEFKDEIAESTNEKADYEMGTKVRWESYWMNDLLTLVVIREHPGTSVDYFTYYFDFSDETRCMGRELLAQMDITEQEFITACRRGAAGTFDHMYAGAGENAGREGLGRLRALTIERVGYDMDQIPFVPKKEGKLTAYLPIASIAGAGWYSQPVALTLQESSKEEQGAPFSETENEQIRAYVVSQGYGLEVFSKYVSKYYLVSECYSKYIQVLAADMGPGESLTYLFALTDQGNVESVDVTNGVSFDVISNSGPLYGVTDIISFEKGRGQNTQGTYETVFAVDKAGRHFDLWEYVQDLDSGLQSCLTGTWECEEDCQDGSHHVYTMEVGESGNCTLVEKIPSESVYVVYTGLLTPLGMGNDGLICGYFLTGPDGADNLGTWAVVPEYDSLTIHTVSGEEMLGERGNILKFQSPASAGR